MLYKKNNLRSTLAAIGVCFASVGWLPAPVYAQNNEEEATSAEEMEEMTVIGIRGGLRKALDIKKNSSNFVDAIASEDIGKLPDQNVAEALQRVPGIAIERSRGEGNFVSVRGLGPQFTRATLNGRTIATSEDGRQFNFDVLATEAVGGIEVIKSPSASLEEGGIGGTVNIKTIRPLEAGKTSAFSLRGYHNDLSDESSPRVSGLYSWVNENQNVGFMVSAAYSERDIREDAGGTLFFLTDSSIGQNAVYDTNLDGIGDDASDLYFPLANNENLIFEDRERTSINAAFQWQPDDNTDFSVDFLYSDFETQESRLTQTAVFTPLNIFGSPTDLVNPDGSLRVQINERADENPNVITGAAFNNFNVTSVSVDDRNERELISVGSNLTKKIGNWELSLDGSYSRATRDRFFNQGVLEATRTTLAPGEANTLTQGRTFPASFIFNGQRSATFSTPVDLSNPDLYTTRNHRIDVEPTEDEEFAIKLDVDRDLDNRFFSSFKAGVGFRAREKDVETSSFESSAADIFPLIDGISTQFNVSDFSFAQSGVQNFVYSIPSASTAYVFDQLPGDEQIVVNAPNSFVISEDVLGAYFQFDIDSNIGGLPLIGNIGLRYVYTDQTSEGSAPAFVRIIEVDGPDLVEVGDITGVRRDSDYDEFLPSLNLRLEVQENMFVRFAASRVLTRPELNDLSPRLDINATIVSANTGNPFLDPFVSDQFDIGFEWYFSDSSVFNAAFFYKDIGNFIQNVTRSNAEFLGTTFVNLTQPQNIASAEVKGFEVGYQQSLDFLLEGLGVIANFTYNDSEQETILDADSGTSTTSSFEGVSDESYNLIAYYDKGRFQARAAYSFRSDFVDQAAAAFGNEISTLDFDQLDLFASYDISDSISVFFEVVNVTDSEQEQNVTAIANGGSSVDINQPFQTFFNGRRYGIGIRGKF